MDALMNFGDPAHPINARENHVHDKELHIGRAYNLLEKLKALLNWKSHQVNFKYMQLRGQGVLTRAQKYLQDMTSPG